VDWGAPVLSARSAPAFFPCLSTDELACPQPYKTAKAISINSRRTAKFSP
jgi:hypothetical protein